MPSSTHPRYLLVSDLDGTLLGDADALSRFRNYHDRHRLDVGVVYASGRFCRSIAKLVQHTSLPAPLALIGGVGTEIWEYPSRTPLADWQRTLAADWDREAVVGILRSEPRIEPQPAAAQSELKVSCRLLDAEPGELQRLEDRFRREGLAATVVYSARRDLDVLPSRADKGRAAAWLAERLGYSHDRVFGAGNSLNDAALVRNGFDGIVVGNADEALKRFAGDHVYVAGNHHADGVLEGLQHWLDGRAS